MPVGLGRAVEVRSMAFDQQRLARPARGRIGATAIAAAEDDAALAEQIESVVLGATREVIVARATIDIEAAAGLGRAVEVQGIRRLQGSPVDGEHFATAHIAVI